MITAADPDSVASSTLAFLDRQRSDITGLVESYSGTSPYVYDRSRHVFERGDKGYLRHQSFTYDEALAVIAYALLGQHDKAAQILKNLSRNFHVVKGDRIGLLNSYRTDRFADGVLLLEMGIDGDRLHTGPNLWVALAAFHYSRLSGDTTQFPIVTEIVKWAIHRLSHAKLPDGSRGGVSMGSGWGPDWTATFSTEHNLDYAALLTIVHAAYNDEALLPALNQSALRRAELTEERAFVEAWLRQSVRESDGRFWTGSNESGLDRTKALDTATFAVLGLGPERLLAVDINPEKLLMNAELDFRVESVIGGQTVFGLDFTDAAGCGNRRGPTIWIEGSYQMVAAYAVMAAEAGRKGNMDAAAMWRAKETTLCDSLERLSRAMSGDNKVPPYAAIRPGETDIITTFRDDWEFQRPADGCVVESVASAAWRLFALKRFNPMSYEPWIQK